MSVFTPVTDDEARALLEHYTLGELESLQGIAQGVENTNFFLTTTTGEYVLTLFEHIPRADLPFYVNLMAHLADHEVRCPQPKPRDDGELLSELNGKPAVIVTRLPGKPMAQPDVPHCRRAGAVLAGLHNAGIDFDGALDNWRGREWRERFTAALQPRITREEHALLESENGFQAGFDDTVLPQGIIHGDFFHDNVLWDEHGEAGVIDFYFACDDVLLYDVAIAVNDWCVTRDATIDAPRMKAFLEGYRHERPFEDQELELWPVMLRRAALRTWLGRLGYNFFPRTAEMTIPKDHAFSRRLLQHHIGQAHAMDLD